ncbi:MAG TPA: hypothetical protein VFE07_13275 [Marmoricola sp.]|nr:hypothetical protein [Marmoricola sp.]
MPLPGIARVRANFRAALHALLGAPRLYRAARRAGAGVIDALGLLGTSALVLFVIAPRAAGVAGRQNAARHFVWQALLTARYGEPVAQAVGRAQEAGSVQPRDSAVDLHNNAAGQAYGAAHAVELAGVSVFDAAGAALRAALAAWDAGELATTRAPGAGPAGHRRRRGSTGRATPREPT